MSLRNVKNRCHYRFIKGRQPHSQLSPKNNNLLLRLYRCWLHKIIVENFLLMNRGKAGTVVD